jgi:type IV pilus assembly protein PilE
MKRTEAGFTLVELMIAVAIVGVLTGIAIVSFKDFRHKSFNVAAVENARLLFLYENVFYDEQREFVAVATSDVDASGSISKTVTTANGNVSFSVRGLKPGIGIAAVTDTNKQTITVGAHHPNSNVMIAIDYDAISTGYRKKTFSGTFSEANLPSASYADDLSSWSTYP